MTEGSGSGAMPPPPAGEGRGVVAPEQPPAAIFAGGLAGALAFALCTFWLGPTAGTLIALAATLLVLVRRSARAAIAFAAAGALSALALRHSTALVFLATVCFGAGLALVNRRPSPPPDTRP